MYDGNTSLKLTLCYLFLVRSYSSCLFIFLLLGRKKHSCWSFQFTIINIFKCPNADILFLVCPLLATMEKPCARPNHFNLLIFTSILTFITYIVSFLFPRSHIPHTEFNIPLLKFYTISLSFGFPLNSCISTCLFY